MVWDLSTFCRTFCPKCKCRPRVVFVVGVMRDVVAPPKPTPRLHNRRPIPKDEIMLEVVLTDIQETTLHIGRVLDKKGNPVQVTPNSGQWLTDNTDLVALAPSADGLSCNVKALGPVSATGCIVTFNGGSDGGAFSGSAHFTTTTSAPNSVELTADPATDQPDAPPAPAAGTRRR